MLRPVSFSAISSTELKITFNKNLSNLITKDNFLITTEDYLIIISTEVYDI